MTVLRGTSLDRSATPGRPDPALVRLIESVVRGLAPEAIYLFGSRARGGSREDSDYDVLVVVADDIAPERLDPIATYALARAVGVAADIVTCRKSGFDRWRDEVGTLSYEASHFGRRIHGR